MRSLSAADGPQLGNAPQLRSVAVPEPRKRRAPGLDPLPQMRRCAEMRSIRPCGLLNSATVLS